jgi:hypothetical protein
MAWGAPVFEIFVVGHAANFNGAPSAFEDRRRKAGGSSELRDVALTCSLTLRF